jgi:hypothetical protein
MDEIEAIMAIFEDRKVRMSAAAPHIRRLCETDPESADDIRHYYDLTARQARREAWQFGRYPARRLVWARARRARAMKRLAIVTMADAGLAPSLSW